MENLIKQRSYEVQSDFHRAIVSLVNGIAEWYRCKRMKLNVDDVKLYNGIYSPFCVVSLYTSDDEKLSEMAKPILQYYFDLQTDPKKDQLTFINSVYSYCAQVFKSGKVPRW